MSNVYHYVNEYTTSTAGRRKLTIIGVGHDCRCAAETLRSKSSAAIPAVTGPPRPKGDGLLGLHFRRAMPLSDGVEVWRGGGWTMEEKYGSANANVSCRFHFGILSTGTIPRQLRQ